MKKLWGICLVFLLAGCTMLDDPEGTVTLSQPSVHTRTERPTASEEIVYCSADVKITNTGDKTIYGCTINAVATSDKGIEHYISLSYDVLIPPSESLYVTIEWSLVRQIDTTTKTATESKGSGTSGSSTSTTTTKATATGANDETGWDKDSLRVIDYYFS